MRRARTRGFTLLEVMLAMAVLLLGAVGLSALMDMGLTADAESRRMLRATAIAQDLVDSIAVWPYQDDVAGTPLAKVAGANAGDIGDTQFQFERVDDPIAAGLADHDEGTLTAMGTGWTGIPAAELGEFQRFWNVEYVDNNGNGVNDMVQIAVIVRWRHGAQWRRVVLLTAKVNPTAS